MTEDPQLLDELLVAEDADEGMSAEVRSAFARLPERQRRALFLREWQECSYAEIAEALGTSESAVETLLFRARRALARDLEAPRRRARDLAGLLGWLRLGFGSAASKVAVGAAVVAATAVGTDVVTSQHATPVAVPHHVHVVSPARVATRSAAPAVVTRARPQSVQHRHVARTRRAVRVALPVVPSAPQAAPLAAVSSAAPAPDAPTATAPTAPAAPATPQPVSPPAASVSSPTQSAAPAPAPEPVTTTVAQTGAAAANVVTTVTGTASSAVDSVAQAVSTAAPATAPVADAAAKTVDGAAKTVDAATQTAASTTQQVVSTVTGLLSGH